MADLAQLGISVDTKGLAKGEKALDSFASKGTKTEKKVAQMEGAFKSFGKNAGAAVAAIDGPMGGISSRISALTTVITSGTVALTAFAVGASAVSFALIKGIAETERLETNMFRLDALIKSTGKTSQVTSDALYDSARELALATLASTEGIMDAQAIMLSFKAISVDSYDEVTEAALNMSSITNQNVVSSMSQLAKALEKPAIGMSALSRSGITFSESQISLAKSLEKNGDLMGAQQVILDELATSEGVARAAAMGLSGAKDTLGQSSQELSINLNKSLGLNESLTDGYNGMADSLFYLSENTDSLVAAGKALSVALGVGVVGALGKVTVSTIASAIAMISHNIQIARAAGLTGAYAVQAGVATVATKALGVATKFLLGPWGLLLSAVGSAAAVFMYSKNSSDEITKSLTEQETAVSKLEDAYKKQSNRSIGTAYIAAHKNLIEIDTQRLEIQEKINNLTAGTDPRGLGTLRLNDQLKELNKTAEGAELKLSAIQKIFDKGLDAVKWADSAKLAAEAAAKAYVESEKWRLSVEGFQTPLEKARAELLKINNALADGTLNNTKGTVGTINKLTESIAELSGSKGFKEQIKSLKDLASQMGKTADETVIFGEIQKSTAREDTKKQTAAIVEQTKAFLAMSHAIEAEDNYQKWIDGITSSSNINQIKALEDEITDVKKAMDDFDISPSVGLEAIDEMQDKINELKGTLSGSDMLGIIGDSATDALTSIQSLSAQGSKDYKKLGVAIQAVSATQAILAVLTQGSGDPYSAFGRMAAMAATVAALGQSVGSLSGGFTDTAAENQESQGLNSWGEKSESMSNAIELTADATDKLVGINTGMLKALQSMQQNISGASSLILRGGLTDGADVSGRIIKNLFDDTINKIGGFDPIMSLIGKFLGGSSKVTDQGIGFEGGNFGDLREDTDVFGYAEVQYKKWRFGKKKRKEAREDLTEASAQFALVFDSIANSVYEGATALGMSGSAVTDAINNFQIESQKISLMNLSAEDQQAEIEAVFSSIFDGLAGDVVPFIDKFQQAGEGLGETLARIATEVSITETLFSSLGRNASDLFTVQKQLTGMQANQKRLWKGFEQLSDAELFAQLADNLATLTGGLEEFASKTASFIEDFAPEDVKFDLVSDAFTTAMGEAGLEVATTGQEYWDLMHDATLDQTAALLNAQDLASEYFGLLEDRSKEQLEIEQAIADARDDARALRMAEAASFKSDTLSVESRFKTDEQKASDAVAIFKSAFASMSLDIPLDSAEFLNLFDTVKMGITAWDTSLRNVMIDVQDEAQIYYDSIKTLEADRLQSMQEATAKQEALMSSKYGLETRLLSAQGEDVALLARARELELNATDESLKSLLLLIFAEEDRSKAAAEAEEKAATLEADRLQSMQEAASFTENFAPEDIKFDIASNAFKDAMANAGLAVAKSGEEYWQLMQVATTDQTAALLNSQELASKYFGLLEDQSKKQLEIEQAIADARDDALQQQQDAIEDLEGAASSAYSMLEKAVNLEKDRAQAVLDNARESYDAEVSRITSLQTALDAQKDTLDNNMSVATSSLNASFNAEQTRLDNVISNIESEKQAVSAAYSERASSLESSISMLTSLSDKLGSAVDTAYSKSVNLDEALSQARSGSFDLANELDLSNVYKSAGSFSSASEFEFSQAVTANKLDQLAGLATSQLTREERSLNALESQEAHALASLNLQITSAESQKTALESQLNSLLGIDTSTLSMSESIAEFNTAKLALDNLNYDEQMSKFEMMLTSADDVYALHELAYNEEVDRLDGLLENGESLLNSALDISTNILSIPDAINDLRQAVLAVVDNKSKTEPTETEKEATQKAIAALLTQQTYLLQQIEDNGAQSLETN